VICQELQEFAVSLYNSKGQCCRAPSGTGIDEILAMDGSMLLVEMMEISREYRGLDLGMHLLHGYLGGCGRGVTKRIGLVVMNPWAITRTNFLRIRENAEWIQTITDGLDEAGIARAQRENTIKLRRQFSRMGFRAISNRGEWADRWWMSMEKYKASSSDDVKNAWLTIDEASRLDVPIDATREIRRIRIGRGANAPPTVVEA
jgi:hypothetical protein